MQVKKFEAPTIQEALENIKRELGPEAIILQTKRHKKGFGLMSRSSVEVTAAVSERSLQKKSTTEKAIPESAKQNLNKLPASRQAEVYGRFAGESRGQQEFQRELQDEARLGEALRRTQDRVDLASGRSAAVTERPQVKGRPGTGGAIAGGAPRTILGGEPSRKQQDQQDESLGPVFKKPITSRRYIDIEDEESAAARSTASGDGFVPGQLSDKKAGAPVGTASLEQELDQLKRMVGELHRERERSGGSGAQSLLKVDAGTELSPALQDAFDQLVVNGIDKRYAFDLIKRVKFELGAGRNEDPDAVLDQLASEIWESTEVLSPLESLSALQAKKSGPTLIALVGPTGVGKTTTVAKVASQVIKQKGLKIGLINLDAYKVAAFDQLATYARILNVPFRSAASAEDFQAALTDFQTLDVVLVDTTGRSHRDPDGLKQVAEILAAAPEVQCQLVLSATTRDTELFEMASRFSIFHPQGLIFSKLDEASTHGALYNVSKKTRLPLLYFGTGQRVPEDIEEASRERLVSLVMDL